MELLRVQGFRLQASLEYRQPLGWSDSTEVSTCRDRNFPILNCHRIIGWLGWEGP